MSLYSRLQVIFIQYGCHRYSAGDHVAIYPTNNAAIVQKLADLLQFDLDQVFSLISVDG